MIICVYYDFAIITLLLTKQLSIQSIAIMQVRSRQVILGSIPKLIYHYTNINAHTLIHALFIEWIATFIKVNYILSLSVFYGKQAPTHYIKAH